MKSLPPEVTPTSEQEIPAARSPYPMKSPGSYLREGREAAGFTQDKIASDLRLNKQRIIDIESDNYINTTIPLTFMRGYLRAYARLINVDTAMILAAFDNLGLPPVQVVAPLPPNPVKRDRNTHYVRWVSYAMGAALIGSLFFWLQSQPNQIISTAEGEESIEVTQQANKTEQLSATMPNVNPEAAAELVTTRLAMANQTVADPSASSSQIINGQNESLNTLHSATLGKVDIEFTGKCWVEIHDANSKLLFSGVKHANQQLSISGKTPLHVVLGNPQAAKVRYNEQPLVVEGQQSNRPVRFNLGE